LHLHSADGAGTESQVMPDAGPKAPQSAPRSVARRAPKKAAGQVVVAPTGRLSPNWATKPAPVTGIVIRPKKGTW
jgi:hypothetical protein